MCVAGTTPGPTSNTSPSPRSTSTRQPNSVSLAPILGPRPTFEPIVSSTVDSTGLHTTGSLAGLVTSSGLTPRSPLQTSSTVTLRDKIPPVAAIRTSVAPQRSSTGGTVTHRVIPLQSSTASPLSSEEGASPSAGAVKSLPTSEGRMFTSPTVSPSTSIVFTIPPETGGPPRSSPVPHSVATDSRLMPASSTNLPSAMSTAYGVSSRRPAGSVPVSVARVSGLPSSTTRLLAGVNNALSVTTPSAVPGTRVYGLAVMVLKSQVHVEEPSHEDGQNVLDDPVLKPGPLRFVTENNTVVVAQRGTTAYLPCIVKNIADGLVTWLRKRDHVLLTVARGTYSPDDRFQVVHDQHPEDWTMQLKFVGDRDAGIYECQVSSHPPASIFLKLKVVEARCVIEGNTEKYVRERSQLRLNCHVEQATTVPEFIFWYHEGVMVNYDKERGFQVTVDLPNNRSALVVEGATRAHSGNYTCEAGQAKSFSNYVHVISGENPAAMQHGGGGGSGSPQWLHCVALLVHLALSLSLSLRWG